MDANHSDTTATTTTTTKTMIRRRIFIREMEEHEELDRPKEVAVDKK